MDIIHPKRLPVRETELQTRKFRPARKSLKISRAESQRFDRNRQMESVERAFDTYFEWKAT